MVKLTKQDRKLLQQKLSQAEKVVREAKVLSDPLLKLPAPFRHFQTSDNITCSFTYCESLRSSPQLLSSCLQLFEINMGDMYKRSSWGLDMKQKERDFLHDDSRFIIVHNPSAIQDILAFGQFRFEVDEDTHEEIMYVYELQVSANIRRSGIGRRLMILLEMISLTTQMKKVMLTVFKFNQPAMSFYMNKMKYIIDPSSPSIWNADHSTDYEILSKQLIKI